MYKSKEQWLLERKVYLGGSENCPYHEPITILYSFRRLQRKNEPTGDL